MYLGCPVMLPFRQIHLDFHTSELIQGVGVAFDADAFATTLKWAGVDSINLFTKCHHGMLYFYSDHPAVHPNLCCDLFPLQVRACKAQGIRAVAYVSLVWDVFAARQHPDWRQRDAAGRLMGPGAFEAPPFGWPWICLNSPFEGYMRDIVTRIVERTPEIDGFWFDILLQSACCCEYCLDRMRVEGIDPSQEAQRTAFADQSLHRFRNEMAAHVRNLLPEARIYFNNHIGPAIGPSRQAYTHLEIESLPSGGWGYEHFPVTVRYDRNLGFEVLAMTGKFHKSWADFGGFKNPASLEYECLTAVSQGAAVCVGDQLHPSGRLDPVTYDLVGSVFGHLESLRSWCEGARPVTQVAVIHPGFRTLHTMDPSATGVLRMFKEAHIQFDFVDWSMPLERYAIVVLPDAIRVDDKQAQTLQRYTYGGGKLLLTGESGLATDGWEYALCGLPVAVAGKSEWLQEYIRPEGAFAGRVPDTQYIMYEQGLALQQTDGESLAEVWKPYFNRNWRHYCSHAQTPPEAPAGRSAAVVSPQVAVIGYPIFAMYKRHGNRVYRELVLCALDRLMQEQSWLVRIEGPSSVESALLYQPDHDRYVLHLFHYIPERRAEAIDIIDDRLPLYDLPVTLALPDAYDSVCTQPEGAALRVEKRPEGIRFTVPRVNGHQLIVIERN